MRNNLRKSLTRGVAALLLTLAVIFSGISMNTAQAVETRPGARFLQYDMLLTAYETEQARRSFWAATVICWNGGLIGKSMSLGTCQAMVTVCAARAYYESPRMRAGITFSPTASWCWKY